MVSTFKLRLIWILNKEKKRKKRTYGERGIRTLGTKKIVQRISNQPLSTTQPSLLFLFSFFLKTRFLVLLLFFCFCCLLLAQKRKAKQKQKAKTQGEAEAKGKQNKEKWK